MNLLTDYLRLRRAVGILGVLLPLALYLRAGWQPSISAYYHTEARDIFVGVLCLISALLGAYRGHDSGDRWCSGSAALALLGVAWVPTGGPYSLAHLACALVFFTAVAVLCERFGRGGYRRRTFLGLGWLIVAGIVGAFACEALGWSIYPPESLAVMAFGAAWLVKGRALEAFARAPA